MDTSARQVAQWDNFVLKAGLFLDKTHEHVIQGIDPGGCYKAIWCRDAAYILRDWFMFGNVDAALQQASLIWSHQIVPGREKLVYGRGSPEMKFAPEPVPQGNQERFQGALPTTIYQEGYSEVYGRNPDIDSTALMISTTSYMLARILKNGSLTSPGADNPAAEHVVAGIGPETVRPLVQRMLAAVDYLAGRDSDGDGLLEQDYNEDWMDTALRAGKIVYSQACWILALKDLSALLAITEKNGHAGKVRGMAKNAIRAAEEYLWSEHDSCYLDKHHTGNDEKSSGILTQDVAMYFIAVTDPCRNGAAGSFGDELADIVDRQLTYARANRALDAIKSRVWKNSRPLVTEVELRRTGPVAIRPYYYHNQTFWPWTTGIEMLARGRLDRFEECDILLTALVKEQQLHNHAFYEWVDPMTNEGNGAFPFRTGLSAVRIAISEILGRLEHRPTVSEN